MKELYLFLKWEWDKQFSAAGKFTIKNILFGISFTVIASLLGMKVVFAFAISTLLMMLAIPLVALYDHVVKEWQKFKEFKEMQEQEVIDRLNGKRSY